MKKRVCNVSKTYSLADISSKLYEKEFGEKPKSSVDPHYRSYKATMRQRFNSILKVLEMDKESLKNSSGRYAIPETLAKHFRILLQIKVDEHVREVVAKKKIYEREVARLEKLEGNNEAKKYEDILEKLIRHHDIDKRFKEERKNIDLKNYLLFMDKLEKLIKEEFDGEEREGQLYLMEDSFAYNLEKEKREFKIEFDKIINEITSLMGCLSIGASLKYFQEYKKSVIYCLEELNDYYGSKIDKYLEEEIALYSNKKYWYMDDDLEETPRRAKDKELFFEAIADKDNDKNYIPKETIAIVREILKRKDKDSN